MVAEITEIPAPDHPEDLLSEEALHQSPAKELFYMLETLLVVLMRLIFVKTLISTERSLKLMLSRILIPMNVVVFALLSMRVLMMPLMPWRLMAKKLMEERLRLRSLREIVVM
jgi:hypothetical protein